MDMAIKTCVKCRKSLYDGDRYFIRMSREDIMKVKWFICKDCFPCKKAEMMEKLFRRDDRWIADAIGE